MTTSSALTVVERHLSAVDHMDLSGMVADYSSDAVLDRPGGPYTGRSSIEAYLATVPERLGAGRIRTSAVRQVDDQTIRVRWSIDGGPSDGTRGVDIYTVADGTIVHHRVVVDAHDF